MLLDGDEQIVWLEAPPVELVEFSSEGDVIIQVGPLEFPDDMLAEIQRYDPAIFNIIEPFLVVIVFGKMKIENIFPDQDELVDVLAVP